MTMQSPEDRNPTEQSELRKKAAITAVEFTCRDERFGDQRHFEAVLLFLLSIGITVGTFLLTPVFPGKEMLPLSRFSNSVGFVLSGWALVRVFSTLDPPQTLGKGLLNILTLMWFLGYLCWFIFIFLIWLYGL